MNINHIPKIKHADSGNFFLIAGPCAIESEDLAIEIALKVSAICDRLQIPYIFKGSYRKANRSRIDSFSGIGDEKALKILQKVGQLYNLPTCTDIHADEEAAMAAEYVERFANSRFPLSSNEFISCGSKNRKNRQYQKRAICKQ